MTTSRQERTASASKSQTFALGLIATETVGFRGTVKEGDSGITRNML